MPVSRLVCHTLHINFNNRGIIYDNEASSVDVKANRSTTGTLALRSESSAAARHVHSLSHILTRSHTHVDNHTCNVNLTAEESRPVITEQRWESHNHKDPNINLNQQMIPDCFAPSVYTWGRFDLHVELEKPIVTRSNVNIALIEPLRSLYVVICKRAFVFLLSLRSHIRGVFLPLASW